MPVCGVKDVKDICLQKDHALAYWGWCFATESVSYEEDCISICIRGVYMQEPMQLVNMQREWKNKKEKYMFNVWCFYSMLCAATQCHSSATETK